MMALPLSGGYEHTMRESAAPAQAIEKETWSPSALASALEGEAPIFVEMTAAWCITCKVNQKIALDTNRVKAAFAETGTRYLVGDWTNQDAQITQYLESYGRNGVPVYVFYGARDGGTGQRPPPVLLPQLLTPGIVTGILRAER
jgi:thiol:disulfide interchange protein DsbD